MRLLCWQCNKTHSLCNAHPQERKNKTRELPCLNLHSRGAVAVPLLHTVHPNTPSTDLRGSNSRGASPHQARKCS